MADLKLSEVYKMATDVAADKNVGFFAFMKSVGKLLVSPVKALAVTLPKKLANVVANTAKPHDDNVVIRSGTKTLIGDDFSSLYESSELKELSTSDGNKISVIKSTSKYGTEMMNGNLMVDSQSEYNVFTDDRKAAYEITLMSKKYASMYSGDTAANEKLSEEYADKMSKYKTYCDEQGISWNRVMYFASSELQTESYTRSQEAGKSTYLLPGETNCVTAEANRVLVNKAHSLLTTCMGDYEDTLCPALGGSITYEQTLDTSSSFMNFTQDTKNWFSDKINFVKENVMVRPWQSIKQGVGNFMSGFESAHSDSEQQVSGTTTQSTVESVDRNVDFLTGASPESQSSGDFDYGME